MPNGPVLKCHMNTGQPNHWNTRQMDTILFSYVRFGILMVGLVHGPSPKTDYLNANTFEKPDCCVF